MTNVYFKSNTFPCCFIYEMDFFFFEFFFFFARFCMPLTNFLFRQLIAFYKLDIIVSTNTLILLDKRVGSDDKL